MNEALSDEHLAAKLRVTENRCLALFCQGRLYPHIYTTLLKRLVKHCSLTATPKDGSSPIRLFNQKHTDTAKKQLFEKLIITLVN